MFNLCRCKRRSWGFFFLPLSLLSPLCWTLAGCFRAKRGNFPERAVSKAGFLGGVGAHPEGARLPVQEFLPARLCASLRWPWVSRSDGAWHPGTAHFLALSCEEKEKGREQSERREKKKAVSLKLAFLGKGSFPGDCPEKAELNPATTPQQTHSLPRCVSLAALVRTRTSLLILPF